MTHVEPSATSIMLLQRPYDYFGVVTNLDDAAAASALARTSAYAEVDSLTVWSPWTSFAGAIQEAPRLPGVYLLREGSSVQIRYVGMAGERAGGARPQGLHGPLSVYLSGKAAVSGFGEAALDRALADPVWVEARLQHLAVSGPQRAKEWARQAIARLAPEVRWAITHDRLEARELEGQIVELLRPFGL